MKTKQPKTITRFIFLYPLAVLVVLTLNSCDTSLDLGSPEWTLWPSIDEAPQLISPENGAIMDNGRTDRLDKVIWDFDWLRVKSANSYHIYVKHQGAQYPVINKIVMESSYHHEDAGAYVPNINRLDWRWKVRGCRWISETSLIYGPWSEERTFDVEPVNTDPPSQN